ncbi:MAG: TonB-dependent receptor [Cyclobacteriaceae bacterium]
MKTILSTVLFAIILATQAQQLTQTVKGRILDQQSKTPIIGATILIKDSDPLLGTVTDVDGYFRLQEIPIGRHTIIISSIGYEPKVLSEILLSSGKEVVINTSLAESLIEMDEVVVVANDQHKGQPLNDLATISAISLSVEETSRYAATFDDPARAAMSQAGVTSGEDDLLNEIVIRGNSPRGLLWRLEGVEIPNPNHFGNIGSSAGGISMLSNNVLSNSDFFTGAFPAQYGNALSGVFDLNLRQGNFDKMEHSFQAGLLGIAAASEGPIGNNRASYLANYRYSTLGLFSKLGINIMGEQEEITFQDFSFKVHLPTKKLGSFSIWGLGGQNSYGYKPNTAEGDWWHEQNVQHMGIAGVTNIAYLSENTYLESIISASGYRIENLIDSVYMKDIETEDFRELSYRISSTLNHKFNAKNSLKIGAIYTLMGFNLVSDVYDWSNHEQYNRLDESDHKGMIQGFVNWQTRPTKWLTVNSGLHTSYFALNKQWYVEPRLGFRAKTTKGAVIGGLGMHSRRETMAMYMATDPETNIKNNEHLGFTKALHGVVGYEFPIANSIKLKTEVYYQHLYNVPVWGSDTTTEASLGSFSILNSTDGFTSLALANDGTGKNYGIELTLEKYFTKGYYFLVTGSLYESKYKGSDGIERNTRYGSNYLANIVGGKEIALGNNGNNTLGINGRIIWAGGKRQAPLNIEASKEQDQSVYNFSENFEFQLADYLRFDLGINYRMNKHKRASVVAINIQNVTGRANESGKWYNARTEEVMTQTQVGFFPNLSYKLEF